MLEACRRSGQAHLTASGAAIIGAIADTMAALKDAGVIVHADPDLCDVAGLARRGRPS